MISDSLRQAAGHVAMGVAALGLLLGLLAAGAFMLPPRTGIAVIGDPTAAMAAILRTEGLPVSAGPFAVIAVSSEPGFAARLYRAGALLVVAVPDAGGCAGATGPRLQAARG